MKSDKCAPVVKLVKLDAYSEHLSLCLCCLARLVVPSCALPLCKASYATANKTFPVSLLSADLLYSLM